jgi:hypothetical protein
MLLQLYIESLYMSFVLATNNYLKRHENHINELVAKTTLVLYSGF